MEPFQSLVHVPGKLLGEVPDQFPVAPTPSLAAHGAVWSAIQEESLLSRAEKSCRRWRLRSGQYVARLLLRMRRSHVRRAISDDQDKINFRADFIFQVELFRDNWSFNSRICPYASA